MWSSQTIRLSCGCEGAGRWDDLWIGQGQTCAKHGEVEVVHMSRVYEARTSRFQLGVARNEGREHADGDDAAEVPAAATG